jgi:hypothetical protein
MRKSPNIIQLGGKVLPLITSSSRLQPELHISARRPAVLLPKFVGPRSDLLLKPPCSKPPLQLLFQFLNKPPEALRCRLVTDVGSEPPCSFDFALQFANIFTLIHGGPLQ